MRVHRSTPSRDSVIDLGVDAVMGNEIQLSLDGLGMFDVGGIAVLGEMLDENGLSGVEDSVADETAFVHLGAVEICSISSPRKIDCSQTLASTHDSGGGGTSSHRS
jgi:hypothetical protein